MVGEVQEFIEHCINTYPMKGRVLEVGARDICGSPRQWFCKPVKEVWEVASEPTERFPEYIGVDLEYGRGVDIVMDAHDIRYNDERFDVVVCCEMLEHDTMFWVSMAEMARVLKSGGYMILSTCGINAAQHNFPSDYWRFLPEALQLLMTINNIECLDAHSIPSSSSTVAIGRKQ